MEGKIRLLPIAAMRKILAIKIAATATAFVAIIALAIITPLNVTLYPSMNM
jgi:hypothetical protein